MASPKQDSDNRQNFHILKNLICVARETHVMLEYTWPRLLAKKTEMSA